MPIACTAAILLVVGCRFPDMEPELMLEGPARVTVDQPGPVDGPDVVLDEGTVPDELELESSDPAVARVEGGTVVAESSGEAVITATWQGQSVSWTLAVEPAVTLRFVEPPAAIQVGEQVRMRVTDTAGHRDVDPGALSWSCTEPAVADVKDGGVVTGREEGVTYLTASGLGSQAMLELSVVAPEPELAVEEGVGGDVAATEVGAEEVEQDLPSAPTPEPMPDVPMMPVDYRP